MARNPFRRAPKRERLTSMTAAVSSAGTMASTALQSLAQPWQSRARLFSKRLGLVSFSHDVICSVGSRSRFVIQQDLGGGNWQEVKTLGYVLDWYRNDNQSFQELISAHLYRVGVDGDRYEVLDDSKDGRASYWVLPIDRVQWSGSNARVMLAPNGNEQDRTALSLEADRLVRMWTPDRDYPLLGDSPMSAVIEDCERYWSLMRYVRKTADSRLAMNKILWTPQDAHVPLPQEMQQPGTVPKSELDVALAQAAKTSFERDDSLQGIMPFILRWDKDLGDPKLIDLARGLEPEVLAHMENAARMIAQGLPLPAQMLLGEGSNHWCMSSDTEILTRDGWVTHDRLAAGDVVMTLDHETGLSEWQPVGEVARFEVEDLPMLSMESRRHSSLSTMNHRWPTIGQSPARTRRWKISETLRSDDFLAVAAPHLGLPTEAKYEDALVELVGWFFTEGECRYRPGRTSPRVVISQSERVNPENCARIRRALTVLYGPAHEGPMPSSRRGQVDETPRWRETARDGMASFSLNVAAAVPLVGAAPDRVVGLDFVLGLTASQLELLIETAVRADGSRSPSGATRFVMQADSARLAGVELAAILAGYSTNLRLGSHDGFGVHDLWWLSISARDVCKPTKRVETYTGIVWCPTTPNRTWLARRNGKAFFTGNTEWLLDEQSFRWGVAPPLERVCNDLTRSFLIPTLRALAPGDPSISDPENFRIWYDPSGVLIHPDRTANALELNLAGLLAAVPTLEAYGYTGAEMMNEAERAIWKDYRAQAPSPGGFGGGAPTGPQSTIEKPPPVPAALTAREVRREVTSALAPFEAELMAFYRAN